MFVRFSRDSITIILQSSKHKITFQKLFISLCKKIRQSNNILFFSHGTQGEIYAILATNE